MTTKDIKTDYGAKGDGKEATATLTIATTTLTSTTSLWVAGDAGIGKKIFIQGAGPSGGLYESTITTFNSATSITLAHAVNTPLSSASKIVSWGSDDTAAFKAFNTAMTGLTGVVLTIPASSGFYCLWETATRGVGNSADPPLFTHGIPQITITGGVPTPTLKLDAGGEHINGICFASQHNLQGGAIMSTPAFFASYARVDTVAAGANSVTCTTHAEASKFAADDWVIMTAVNAQVAGDPPLATYCEYFQVVSSNTTTGVVTLTPDVVSDQFLSTYPGGFGATGIVMGPATLHKLAPAWNTEANWENVHVSDLAGAVIGHQIAASGRLVTITDCALDAVVNATVLRSLTTTNTDWLAGSEVDKLNETITVNGGSMDVMVVQSASGAKHFQVNDCTVFQFNGTPQQITCDNCTISNFKVGSAGPTPAQSVTVTNSTVSSFPNTAGFAVLHVDGVESVSTMTGGVIVTTNNDGDAGWVTMFAPGNTWMMCDAGSNPNIYGPAFRVLSITGSTPQGPDAGPHTPVTMVTSLSGGWPAVPAGATKSVIRCPMPSITFSGVSGCFEADDLSNSPPGLPYLSYLKRTYDKSTLTGTSNQYYLLGKVTSLIVNVLTPYAVGASALTFRPLAGGDNEPVVLVDGTTTTYAPKINLRVAGKRTITPDGVFNDQGVGGGSGGLSGDADLDFPEPYIWMYNPSTSHISANVSGDTTSLSYYWEIITDQGVEAAEEEISIVLTPAGCM